MTALGALGVRSKVTAIAPMTENMPGGAAMKPGDVLTPRSGTTIEVLNTDAEGRLILADGLSLAAEECPDLIVDVATLTGAAIVALGKGVGALLSNSDEASTALLAAGEVAGESLWRLPLVEAYEGHIASEVADIKNVGVTGEAGTISAGLFLQRFVDGRPWVHLDIAGPGRSDKDTGYLTKGGTAFSLMTILEYLRELD
jgi:leucyl aminopeptidase